MAMQNTTLVRYGVPLLGLAAVGLAYLLPRRRKPLPRKVATAARVLSALPLVASGTVHLLRPEVFLPLLPRPFPVQNWIIVWTGVAELAGAVGLFVPPTRRLASVSLAVFLVAIFPANIYVAGRNIHGLPMPSVPVRWGMQAAYMLLILAAGWGAPRRLREPA